MNIQLSPVSALFLASVALLGIGLIALHRRWKEAQATMTTANPVLELSESNFDEIVSGGKPVLVEFSAPWCATCQSMRPIFDDMAVNHGQVLFARINVVNNQALTDEL